MPACDVCLPTTQRLGSSSPDRSPMGHQPANRPGASACGQRRALDILGGHALSPSPGHSQPQAAGRDAELFLGPGRAPLGVVPWPCEVRSCGEVEMLGVGKAEGVNIPKGF